jgi:aspartyl-tRNA synthetase
MEYDPDIKRFVALHHPFTAPLEEDEHLLEDAPERVRSRAYDLVLNGTEIGGGSIRIHRSDLQRRVFGALGLGDEEVSRRFGFFVKALDQGAPPHGGIALGFDRLVALMLGADTIREVIPFPKTQRATCLLTGAPGEAELEQLLELSLKLDT